MRIFIDLQVTLGLTDKGEPVNRAGPDLDLVFDIQRNQQPPIFFDLIGGRATATIDEDEASGFLVKSLSATDSDPSVSVVPVVLYSVRDR